MLTVHNANRSHRNINLSRIVTTLPPTVPRC
jgi:hypothetical protein